MAKSNPSEREAVLETMVEPVEVGEQPWARPDLQNVSFRTRTSALSLSVQCVARIKTWAFRFFS